MRSAPGLPVGRFRRRARIIMTASAEVTSRSAVLTPSQPSRPTGPRPDLEPEPSSTLERILVATFGAVPMLALLAAIPLAWGWGLGWHDVVLAIVFYAISGLGISMGFHRYFTHGSFKATRGFKIALGIAGSLVNEGPPPTNPSSALRLPL